MDISLPLIGPGGKGIAQASVKFDSYHFSGNPRRDLTRVHHPGQYLIKAFFKFDSNIMELVVLGFLLLC